MKKKSDLGVQTAVRLPRDVHDRLKGSDRGVSEEIRHRLQRTFDDEKIAAPTRQLLADIVQLAEQVELDQGVDWYLSDRAQEVFAVAVLARVKAFRTSPPGIDIIRDPNDQRDPFTIGQTIEWLDRRRS